MSIDFFLDNLTPQATEYVSSNISTNNQESYNKLKKLFLDNYLELRSFDDIILNITTFNWSDIEQDRNWWWQIHSFPFLNWYLDSYSLQSEEERKKYFLLCIKAIDNWDKKTKIYDSPLAWHDHGTAFRTRNIVNWLIFCYTKNTELNIVAVVDEIELSKLILNHLEWLLDSRNYSKHTNHGFDQAMILLTISIMFNNDELEPQRLVSRQRLEEEIKFAFTDQGVHKENSPGYQKFMLGRLKQLSTLNTLGEQQISKLAESYIEKAEKFLMAITLPNGYLPMIGDTKGFELGILEKDIIQDRYEVFDYSKSGYVIIKGNSEKIRDFYLLLKNCHDSNYHRHDDDLMIYLWCNGETILGDGGLYSHNESSPTRKFLRSNLAHSVPFSKGEIERDRNKIPLPELFYDKELKSIIGKSYASGRKISRTIQIKKIAEGIINISDEVLDLPLFMNYYFEDYAEVKIIKRNEALVNVGSVNCSFGFGSMRSINLYKGNNNNIIESSFLSRNYNERLESMRILLSSSYNKAEIIIKLKII